MTFTMEMATDGIRDSFNMFMFLAVELTLLFLAISYFVGILQAYIPASRIQRILSSKNGTGYIIAGFLGSITPFCSCSTIPFLKGLLRARADFGAMMVFLFASPLLNPVIIGLIAATFGVKVAAFYFAIAMGVSVLAGYSLNRLGFAKYVKEDAYTEPASNGCSSNECSDSECSGPMAQPSKWRTAWDTTWTDFKKALPYLVVGISLGSVIYGFMPTELISRWASDDQIFAVPAAAIIGIPLYIRAEAVIPLSAALAAKGMSLGAVLALIIGSAGASLTEVILLKSILGNRMIAAFLFVVLGMAVSAGYLYRFIF